MRCWLFVAAISACSSHDAPRPPPPPPAPSHEAGVAPAADSAALGALTFELSEGKPEARDHFRRGLLAMHSFWYDEAEHQFRAAIDADPTMNMAYWGAAMASCKLLWGDDDITTAREMLRRMPAPDHLSPREQAWVLAAVELLTPDDVRTSRQRFAAAMEQLNATFPDDESATFLALALLSTIRPDDPDPTAIRKRAGELAAKVFAHNPNHPGAAHYAIHAYDTPELAPLALPYAKAYAKIAPAAFHARHMPAHIFVRLGMWDDAIASCQSAWEVSLAAAGAEHRSADHRDFHSLSWLVDLDFEVGHRKQADQALATFAEAVRGGLDRGHRTLYVREVASYLARSDEWSRVDELLAPLDRPATDEFGAVFERETVLETRARAAAMQHDVARTRQLLADLHRVEDEARPVLEKMQAKDEVVRIDRTHERLHEALLARARGDDRALLRVLRASAAAETEPLGEANLTAFVTHEQIADALLRLGEPAQALAEYALVLARQPGRARSLLGSARAAARAGQHDAARDFYRKLLAQMGTADPGFEGIAEARAATAP